MNKFNEGMSLIYEAEGATPVFQLVEHIQDVVDYMISNNAPHITQQDGDNLSQLLDHLVQDTCLILKLRGEL